MIFSSGAGTTLLRNRNKREGYDSLCLRAFPKDNLILTHYMLRAWCLHLLDGMGH